MDIPRVDERGQKTLYVSWSRLYEFEKCQQLSSFRRQGKGDTVVDGRRFIHGTLADRAVRKFLDQDEPHERGQLDRYVDELWDDIVVKNDEYKINWKGNPKQDQEKVRALVKTVVNNVEPFLFEKVLPLEFQAEYRFRQPIKIPDLDGAPRTIVLNGGIDIAARDPQTGKAFLYDLKATQNEQYIHQGIMPQLIFYSIVWTIQFGTPLEDILAAFLTPACKIQYHELDVSSLDRQHLMTRIIKFAHHVWSEEEPVCTTDTNQCWGCACKSICPLWADVIGKTGSHRVSLAGTGLQRIRAKEEANE